MGEILPDGSIQGWTCGTCGKECNMQATGHGPGICDVVEEVPPYLDDQTHPSWCKCQRICGGSE